MKVYHYTDINGLKGIIDNKALWATDIKFLNDSQELYAGIEKLKEICTKSINLDGLVYKGKLVSDFENSEEILAGLKITYSAICDTVIKNLENRDLYITSFSDKRDNLRQWMSYCPENGGYCIVFDSEKLRKSQEEELKAGYVTNLDKVYYGNSELKSFLDSQSIIDNLLNSGLKNGSFAHKLSNKLMFHCCAIKPKEFYDESETRLIIQSTTAKIHDTKFRTKSGVFIPYLTHPASDESIVEIIIGPNINMNLAKLGLKDYLSKRGINCPINKSICSLRVL